MARQGKEEAITGEPSARQVEAVDRNFDIAFQEIDNSFEKPEDLATGDVFYWDEDDETLIALPIGDDDQVLTLTDGVPAWEDTQAADDADVEYWNEDTLQTVGYVAKTGTIETLGVGAVTLSSGTDGNDAVSTWTALTTGAVSGNSQSLRGSSFDLIRRSYDPDFLFKVATGAAITSIRIWVGIASGALGDADTLVTAGRSGFAFRFSTVASDTTWQAVTCDGSTQSASPVGPTVALDTPYKLRVVVDDSAGTATFTVNDGTAVTLSSNLPAAATPLSHVLYVFTQTAAARTVKVNRFQCRVNG